MEARLDSHQLIYKWKLQIFDPEDLSTVTFKVNKTAVGSQCDQIDPIVSYLSVKLELNLTNLMWNGKLYKNMNTPIVIVKHTSLEWIFT